MAINNVKLFTDESFSTNGDVAKIKTNREYLITEEVANELNTYLSFDPFPTLNEYGKVDAEGNLSGNVGTPGVRSIFNKYSAVVLGSDKEGEAKSPLSRASQWRISNNVPLMDTRENRKAIKSLSDCTVKNLVKSSEQGILGKSTYSYSDFMYCKYLGKVSNNYLVTLRRFPTPVDDYISTMGVDENTRKMDGVASKNPNSIGCMVTWMGTPGNEMSNLLKYSVSMPFKEQTAQLLDNNMSADSQSGIFNSIAAAFDDTYRKQYKEGMVGDLYNNYLERFFPIGKNPYNAADWSTFRDSTKVYGPVDVVKTVYTRSEDGIKFDQKFSLVFDYELRSYNGINPRQAMLDLLSNILNVVYTTGTFWGGGYRGGGAHQNNVFTNLNMFKVNGGFADYVNAISQDWSTLTSNLKNSIDTQGGILNTIKNVVNQLGSVLIAGALNKLGRPVKQQFNSSLSPAPVGFWHLTIGNPFHPIMSVGNLIITNCNIEHYGPLGLDDFPTGLKVTVELTRGKPRDIRDIEKMYMHGNDRIYSPMGVKIFDMYKKAKEYKGPKDDNSTLIGGVNTLISGSQSMSIDDVKNLDITHLGSVLQKYFGEQDTYSICVPSTEMEFGSTKKKDPNKGNGNKNK